MSEKIELLEKIKTSSVKKIDIEGKPGYLSRPLIDALKVKSERFFRTVKVLSNKNILRKGYDFDIVAFDKSRNSYVPSENYTTDRGVKTKLPYVFYTDSLKKIVDALEKPKKESKKIKNNAKQEEQTQLEIKTEENDKDKNILEIRKSENGYDVTVLYQTISSHLEAKVKDNPESVSKEDLFLFAGLAQSKIKEDKPKVEFADAVMLSDTDILLKDYAKILKIGSTKFNQWLKENGFLMKDGLPYSKYVPHLFTIKEEIIKKEDSPNKIINQKTCISPSGQVFFQQKSQTDEALNKLIKEEKRISSLPSMKYIFTE